VVEMPARVRRWRSEVFVSLVMAWEAVLAEGRVRRVGRVRVLRVYERPYSLDQYHLLCMI
jgi:hypothetical protein